MRKYFRELYLSLFGSFKVPSNEIHIINSHFVSCNNINIIENQHVFRQFLKFLSLKCKFLKIEDAVRMISSGEKVDFPCVSFSFDDGFEECYSVIAPILEEFNCNAAFFINSNYVSSTNDYKVLFEKRINVYSKRPMNWQNIRDLHQRGHIIGSHTKDHFDLAKLSFDEVVVQIIDDKHKLENMLNYKCEYFAWPYGQKQHFSKAAFSICLDNFKYIFSGTNYEDYFSYSGSVINRRHIEPFWKKSHINYFLSVKKNYATK